MPSTGTTEKKNGYVLFGQQKKTALPKHIVVTTILLLLILVACSVVTLSICLSLASRFTTEQNKAELGNDDENPIRTDTTSSSTTTTMSTTTTTTSRTSTTTYSSEENEYDENEAIYSQYTHIRKRVISHGRGFKEASHWISSIVDTRYDPCDNFYEYACGGFKTRNMTNAFTLLQSENDDVLIDQIAAISHKTDLKAIRQTRYVYDACMKYKPEDYQGEQVIKVLRWFEQQAGIVFPLFDQTDHQQVRELTPAKLAKTLGLLTSLFGIKTLLMPEVETNWKEPDGKTPYMLYVGQGSLSLPTAFYKNDTFHRHRGPLEESMKRALVRFGQAAKMHLDERVLDSDVDAMIAMEARMAREMMADEDQLKQWPWQWNPLTPAQAQNRWPFVDWTVYLRTLATRHIPALATEIEQQQKKSSNFRFGIKQIAYLNRLNEAISVKRTLTQRTLQNYLLYQFLVRYMPFINPPQIENRGHHGHRGHAKNSIIPNAVNTGQMETFIQQEQQPLNVNSIPKHHHQPDKGMSNHSCANLVRFELIYAAGRLYTEAYPLAMREKISSKMHEMINKVVLGFQSMVDGLPWMSFETKLKVYRKILNLQKNVIAPDWIFDDSAFNRYHRHLTVLPSDSFLVVRLKLAKFNHLKEMEFLVRTIRDRTDYAVISPASVNAWYQPQLNSISFPMASLHAPFFDTEWPTSMNYGALGAIMGHEFTHGYDNMGMQWDGVGKLDPWMSDRATIAGFQRMRQCVVEQFNDMCPLPRKYAPANCVDGYATQSENMADNGGLIAAYRAYKNMITVYGPDRQLPGLINSHFSHDQLFFLSYASIWCERERSPEAMHRQILTDMHAPNKYRVLGTVKNFPAFQDAFHCPTGTRMSPKSRCNVWVGDN